MNQLAVGDPQFRKNAGAPSTGRRVLGALVAAAALCAGAAHAVPIVVTTTGTITSGSDASNLLGAGTNLTGDLYTLSVSYDSPTSGPNFFSDGSSIALDTGDPLTGSVTLTVAGHSLTTAIATSYGATLEEDAYDLASSNAGTDAAGNYVDAFQTISTASPFVTVADLQTSLTHLLTTGDSGSDIFQYNNAAFTQSINFSGTSSSVILQAVPEPASWALLALGLGGLGLRARRRPRAGAVG